MKGNGGYIYVLGNSASSSICKVGRTNNLQRRLNEQNSASNSIGTWKIHWWLEVPDAVMAERMALDSLRPWKVTGKREQFRIGPKRAAKEVAVALQEWSSWGKDEAKKRSKLKKIEYEKKLYEMQKERDDNDFVKAKAEIEVWANRSSSIKRIFFVHVLGGGLLGFFLFLLVFNVIGMGQWKIFKENDIWLAYLCLLSMVTAILSFYVRNRRILAEAHQTICSYEEKYGKTEINDQHGTLNKPS